MGKNRESGFLIAKVKIHRVGGSLMVVLPPSWILGANIQAGDIMEGRFLTDGRLLLSHPEEAEL